MDEDRLAAIRRRVIAREVTAFARAMDSHLPRGLADVVIVAGERPEYAEGTKEVLAADFSFDSARIDVVTSTDELRVNSKVRETNEIDGILFGCEATASEIDDFLSNAVDLPNHNIVVHLCAGREPRVGEVRRVVRARARAAGKHLVESDRDPRQPTIAVWRIEPRQIAF